MIVTASSAIDRFRLVAARMLGLAFDDSRTSQLLEVLQRRSRAHGLSVDQYLDLVDSTSADPSELRALAGELTVGETYFFRNIEQFRAFREVVFPKRMQARMPARRLRILSAGCASGEEAYSVAIEACASLPDAANWLVEIRGVDINASSIEKARTGRYSAWSLRETPDDVRARWFRHDGRDFDLDDAIRQMVTFEERNLVNFDPSLWPANDYDVVFLRNVLMYMTADAAQTLVSHVVQALAPGGFLFLGHAETLRGLSRDFHLFHSHGTFYYQAKERHETGDRAIEPAENAQLVSEFESAESWVDAIQRASERVRTLTQRPTLPAETDLRHTWSPSSRHSTSSGASASMTLWIWSAQHLPSRPAIPTC